MPSNEVAFEMLAQEIVDPRAAGTEAIEFDDLDTVLMPALPSANEASSDDLEPEIELELSADAIDALLTSGEIQR